MFITFFVFPEQLPAGSQNSHSFTLPITLAGKTHSGKFELDLYVSVLSSVYVPVLPF